MFEKISNKNYKLAQVPDPAYQYEKCPVVRPITVTKNTTIETIKVDELNNGIPPTPSTEIFTETYTEQAPIVDAEGNTIMGKDLDAVTDDIVKAAVWGCGCPECSNYGDFTPSADFMLWESKDGNYFINIDADGKQVLICMGCGARIILG